MQDTSCSTEVACVIFGSRDRPGVDLLDILSFLLLFLGLFILAAVISSNDSFGGDNGIKHTDLLEHTSP